MTSAREAARFPPAAPRGRRRPAERPGPAPAARQLQQTADPLRHRGHPGAAPRREPPRARPRRAPPPGSPRRRRGPAAAAAPRPRRSARWRNSPAKPSRGWSWACCRRQKVGTRRGRWGRARPARSGASRGRRSARGSCRSWSGGSCGSGTCPRWTGTSWRRRWRSAPRRSSPGSRTAAPSSSGTWRSSAPTWPRCRRCPPPPCGSSRRCPTPRAPPAPGPRAAARRAEEEEIDVGD
ncbi:unnamed protein product [Bubo scandiacus]